MKNIKTGLCVAMVLALWSVSVKADVLISNNFETAGGSLEDWTPAGNAYLYTYDGVAVDDFSTSSSNAVELYGNGGTITLTEPLPLASKGYTSVTFTFPKKWDNGSTSRRIQIQYAADGANFTWIANVDAGEGNPSSVTLTVGSGLSGSNLNSLNSAGYSGEAFTDTAKFSLYYSTGNAGHRAYPDDISITAAPDFTGTYWDLDGATAGAGGARPSGTWDATTHAWNIASDGTGSTGAWAPGFTAIFSAGTNATGIYGITLDGTQSIGGLAFEEGTVTLSGGELKMTADSTVFVASDHTATIATPFSEDTTPRILNKVGGGKLILSGNNVGATGGMELSGGMTQFESTSAINGTGRDVTVDLGAAVMFGASFGTGTDIASTLLNRIVAASAGTILADNHASTDFDFNTAGLTNASLGAGGTVNYTGALTPNGAYRLGGGGGTLTMNSGLSAGNGLVVYGPGTVQLNGYTSTVTRLTSAGIGQTLENGSATDMRLTVSNSTDCTYEGTLVDGGSGAFALAKAGSGEVKLSGVNTYSGDLTMNAGTLNLGSASALGSPSSITFAGDSTLTHLVKGGSLTFSQPIAIHPNVTATFHTVVGLSGGTFTFDGLLSGSGTLSFTTGGGDVGYGYFHLNNAASFTGTVQIASDYAARYPVSLYIVSLGDGGTLRTAASDVSGDLSMNYTGSGAVFNTRQFEIAGAAGMTLDASGSGPLVINTPLSVTASSARTLTLGGTSTDNNTFAGTIADGASAVVSLTKTGAGTWVLAGTNTYSGDTTVSAGTLALQGEQCLPDTGTLNITAGTVRLDHREIVGSLQFSGSVQSNGTWGAIGKVGAEFTDSRFSGTKLLYVGVDFPPTETVLLVR